jgi:hypothetical protein
MLFFVPILMRIGIIYEHTSDVTRLVLAFDTLFTARGWQVETDYRNQETISQAGWFLPMLGTLQQCDVYLCVETIAGVEARSAGKTRGLTDELAFLSTSGKPMARTLADAWFTMSPEQLEFSFNQIVDDLVYRLGPTDEPLDTSS